LSSQAAELIVFRAEAAGVPTVPPGSWRPIAGFGAFACMATNCQLAGSGLVCLELVGATNERGDGAILLATTGILSPSRPTVGDYAVLEVDSISVNHAGKSRLTYVAPRVTASAEDLIVLWLSRGAAMFASDDLTRNRVS
jgi:hypothetical protein